MYVAQQTDMHNDTMDLIDIRHNVHTRSSQDTYVRDTYVVFVVMSNTK